MAAAGATVAAPCSWRCSTPSALRALRLMWSTKKIYTQTTAPRRRRDAGDRAGKTAAAVAALTPPQQQQHPQAATSSSSLSCSGCAAATTAAALSDGLGPVGLLPESVRRCMNRYLTPVDRLCLQQTCRAFHAIFGEWDDVVALEIRLKEEILSAKSSPESASSKSSFIFQRRFFGAKRPNLRAEKTDGGGQPGSEDVEPFGVRTHRYHVRVWLAGADRTYRLRTAADAANPGEAMRALLERPTALRQLTVWNACLTSEFAATVAARGATLETLRLWNCGAYFFKRPSNREKIIETMLSLPRLRELLVLDTRSAAQSFERPPADQSAGGASVESPADHDTSNSSLDATVVRLLADDPAAGAGGALPTLHKSLAAQICAPLENIQLTNLYLPMQSLELIAETCASTCTRLAIGCTFGKAAKRAGFLAAIGQMRKLVDLDFPSFIFRLDESPQLDADVRQLIDALPLISIGFRHYNSSVLFRFVENNLPAKIRILRIHHNASRVPYFADLGSGGASPAGSAPSSKRYSINASASSFSLTSDPTAGRQFKKHSASSYTTLSSALSSSCSSGGSISSLIIDASLTDGSADGGGCTPMITPSGLTAALADRLRAIKARLVSPPAAESVSRRFTVGSRFQFASRKKFSVNSSFSLIGDPKQRKHSLDCNNNNSNNNNSVSNKYSYDTVSGQQSYHNSSYSLDGRQPTVAAAMSRLSPQVIDEFDVSSAKASLPPDELARRLESRGLTIFAIAEEKRSRRTRRVYKRRFCGVDCVYVAESADMQEVFGRMASPMMLPYVYSKSLGGATRCATSLTASAVGATNWATSALSPATPSVGGSSRYRIVRGDIVRPIPLSSLGMESDYEQSDWEDA